MWRPFVITPCDNRDKPLCIRTTEINHSELRLLTETVTRELEHMKKLIAESSGRRLLRIQGLMDYVTRLDSAHLETGLHRSLTHSLAHTHTHCDVSWRILITLITLSYDNLIIQICYRAWATHHLHGDHGDHVRHMPNSIWNIWCNLTVHVRHQSFTALKNVPLPQTSSLWYV